MVALTFTPYKRSRVNKYLKQDRKLIPLKNPCWCCFCRGLINKGRQCLVLKSKAYKGDGYSVRHNVCVLCLDKLSKQINKKELKLLKAKETESKL